MALSNLSMLKTMKMIIINSKIFLSLRRPVNVKFDNNGYMWFSKNFLPFGRLEKKERRSFLDIFCDLVKINVKKKIKRLKEKINKNLS